MKSQARLRLRQAGKHHWTRRRTEGERAWAASMRTNMARAFEYNCHPKHYDTGIQEPCYTMDYVTGITTWHGPSWTIRKTYNILQSN